MGRAALIVVVMIIAVGAVPAYRAYTRHRDLIETIAWMDQTYNPHEGGSNYGQGHGEEIHYRILADHSEEVTESFRDTFSYKGKCNMVIHYETIPVGLFKTIYSNGDYTLSLCDIDPATIKVDKFDWHKDAFNCNDPEAVKLFDLNCDNSEVEFHTWNEVPKIKDNGITTFANLTGKNHEAKRDSMGS